jgi:riboflavin kinase/FMN adenylyltransferase
MKVWRGDPRRWSLDDRERAVTVGVYDGVHSGHRHVFRLLVCRAAELGGLETVVVTFDPHPLQVVAPDRMPPLLTTIEQRLELFASLGLDAAAVLPFDETLRASSAAEFTAEILQGVLHARLVVVGEDFRFGRDRVGNVVSLAELGDRMGFLAEAAPLTGGDEPLSSTAVRRLIVEGDVASAALALGRHHELRGPVVAGEGRGRALGVPTANVRIPQGMAVPGRGVYAVWAAPSGGRWREGVANVGVRPTFGGGEEVLEVHLLEGGDDLYDLVLRVAFVERLRDERRFADVAALVAQIAEDATAARRALEAGPPR